MHHRLRRIAVGWREATERFASSVRTPAAKISAIVALVASSPATSVLAQELRSLQPVFYVEDEGLARYVMAVGYVFSVKDIEVFLQQDIEKANLIFVSIPGVMKGGEIHGEYLDMFGEGIRREITENRPDSSLCYILEFTKPDGQAFLLAINDPSNGTQELNQRCFLLSLSFFDDFTYAGKQKFDELPNQQLLLAILGRLNNE